MPSPKAKSTENVSKREMLSANRTPLSKMESTQATEQVSARQTAGKKDIFRSLTPPRSKRESVAARSAMDTSSRRKKARAHIR